MSAGVLKVAVLACAYNRLEKTKAFLESVIAQNMPQGFALTIYLLDDKSTDGTGDYVREHFPQVNVITGSGSLFWAGGMYAVWKMVMEQHDYDFYLLMNDDVQLFDNVLERLLNSYNLTTETQKILIGTVLDTTQSKITYGGHKITNKYTGKAYKVEPDENNLLECEMGNANIMLVDKGTVAKIGILSDQYIHSFSDWDYTLNAVRHGIKVYVAPGYYGYCENDHGVPWLSGASLRKRIEFLYSPKGLEYKSFMIFMKRNFPYFKPVVFLQLWLRTLLPVVYDRFK